MPPTRPKSSVQTQAAPIVPSVASSTVTTATGVQDGGSGRLARCISSGEGTIRWPCGVWGGAAGAAAASGAGDAHGGEVGYAGIGWGDAESYGIWVVMGEGPPGG